MELNSPTMRMLAVALIQDGIGRLSEETAASLASFSENGMGWRDYAIFRLNGSQLPPEFITHALFKKWMAWPQNDVQGFTRQILHEWGLLEE